MNVLNGSKSRKLAFNGDAKNLDEETLNHKSWIVRQNKVSHTYQKKSLKKREKMEKRHENVYLEY